MSWARTKPNTSSKRSRSRTRFRWTRTANCWTPGCPANWRAASVVNGYTEVVWKIDLNNFFKTAFLRLDKHAQEEVRVLLEIAFSLAKPLFPIAFQAFEDYVLHGQRLSVFEYEALVDVLAEAGITREILVERMVESGLRRGQDLSNREKSEFADKFFM